MNNQQVSVRVDAQYTLMLLTAYAHYKKHINVNPLLCTVGDAHIHCYGGDREVQCDTDMKLIVWGRPMGDIYIFVFGFFY